MTRWALRIVVLLVAVLLMLVFFRVEHRDGALVIVPRTAEQRRALWPFSDDADRADRGKTVRSTPAEPVQRAPAAPPEDRLNRRDRQALEDLLEEELH